MNLWIWAIATDWRSDCQPSKRVWLAFYSRNTNTACRRNNAQTGESSPPREEY